VCGCSEGAIAKLEQLLIRGFFFFIFGGLSVFSLSDTQHQRADQLATHVASENCPSIN
jgi:hypothetical protein